MSKTYMAVDQYGQTYHDLGQHPRKELLSRLGRKRASKMYVDSKDGQTYHVGWIIAGLWLSVFEVKPMRVVWRWDETDEAEARTTVQ